MSSAGPSRRRAEVPGGNDPSIGSVPLAKHTFSAAKYTCDLDSLTFVARAEGKKAEEKKREEKK
jgi:hypothetical protein